MRTSLIRLALAAAGLTLTIAAVAPLVAGQGQAPAAGQPAQPGIRPGAVMRRPGDGRAPEFPEPTITQYKPRTTLKTAQHPVPRAKFPVIDVHSHQPTPIAEEQFATVVKGMDANNLRVLVNVSGAQGERLTRAVAALKASRFKDRMVQFTDIDFRDVGPGWSAKAVAQLEADVKAGALGIGEISKSFGLRVRKADGTRLKIDDPELDPVWAAAGRLGVPVLIHTAEPQEFFEPIDFQNERWLELALYRDRRYPAGEFPRFEELMEERNRMFRKHPKTTFIAAHFAYHANDLARAAALLDQMPHVHLEVGAILAELGRQPRAAREFFVKYQDRILFGKDSFQPDEFPYFWRVFETNDEYFDYYRDYHAFWKLYGMGLPDDVLKKLYYKNALRLIPGLPKEGWPQ
jgi:predicted TIM-barrel fold metal-dependent hydrolase